MKVTWAIDDGYVGIRTKQTIIDDDELADCETDEEREELISDAIQSDFEQRVSWREIRRDKT